MSRLSSHAGTWYPENSETIVYDIDKKLKALSVPKTRAKVIISPHAGYSYCLATQAHGFNCLKCSNRIVILGPSHFFPLRNVGLPYFRSLNSPIQNLQVDTGSIQELQSRGFNLILEQGQDIKEHSVEMQLPFISYLQPSATIVPLLVGKLDSESKTTLIDLLSEWISDPYTTFVVSSDFCHWGERFNYKYLPRLNSKSISLDIEALDKQSLLYFQNCDASGFRKYLKKSRNTICGRDSIELMLNVMSKYTGKLLDYSQSTKISSLVDSQVSYMSYGFFPE
eukprot:NODE_500_length_7578_cov_0.067790.p3 type:complete len:281 gc:universal NODE_500_length_7578_cov_0.067790:4628-5470(+)